MSAYFAPPVAGAFPGSLQAPGTEPVRAELVAEHAAIAGGGPFWVGVRLEMRDGWHINWINPGDAGLAPRIEWALPPGFSAEEIQWPYPRRHDVSGLSIFGYDGEIILMSRVRPPAALSVGDSIRIGAQVTWLACRESCVPGEASLTLTLPVVGQPAAGDSATRLKSKFELFREEVPVPLAGWRVGAKLSGDHFTIEAAPPEGETAALQTLVFFPFLQGIIENSAPQKLARMGNAYRLEIRRDRMSQDKPDRLSGILVSESEWGRGRGKAVAIDVPVD
ncbi:MAG: Thiol:disulfide interchange protein [Candidatus Krumholzibacteriota bacterium]|nr:Thiol:disulfide interchange protein [Candidatus Krumholzibacteriota bacterium]